MKSWLRFILFYWALFTSAFAEQSKSGVGSLANKALEPVTILYNVIGTASFAIGVLFLLASIIRYVDYRTNPLRTTLSTVFFLLISGMVLVILPFASMLFEGGIPFFLSNIFSDF